MTLQQFMDRLHSEYQGDTETPEDTEEDWDVRLNILYGAINDWETAENVLWLELWTMLSDAVDGDTATDGTSIQYDCPTDFRFPGGFVRLTVGTQVTKYSVVRPEKAELSKGSNITMSGQGNICWFTGNKRSGFKINFLTAPEAGTIDYPYYKDAFLPTAAAHVIEMSDPWFAVRKTLSKLHELDGEGDRAGLALSLASNKLEGMKSNNSTPIWFQDNAIPDRDTDIDTGGFGS